MFKLLHVKTYGENDELTLDTKSLIANSPEVRSLPEYKACIELVRLCVGVYDFNFRYGRVNRQLRYNAYEDSLNARKWIVKDIDEWFDELRKVLSKDKIKKVIVEDIIEYLKEARLDFKQLTNEEYGCDVN